MVIYIAFANDEINFLEELVKEEQAIRNEFVELEREGRVKLKVSKKVRVDDFFEVFRSYQKEIRIFHFGGHADQNKLYFDNESANGEGIARRIYLLENLKLVFLNGCSTKGHVVRLLELGVKVVIATSAAIEDGTAYSFAKNFYSCIASNLTIEESFEAAVSHLEINEKVAPNKIRIHSISSRDVVPLGSEEPNPWGLFFMEENRSTLKWRIAPKIKRYENGRNSYNALRNFINQKIENQLLESYSDLEKIDLHLTNIISTNDKKRYNI